MEVLSIKNSLEKQGFVKILKELKVIQVESMIERYMTGLFEACKQ